MDGRVKTLHPKLYAGLLAVRDDPAHVEAAAAQRRRAGRSGLREPVPVRAHRRDAAASSDDEVIENIDIGGPTMIRAAAKNFKFAAPVVSPASYDAVLDELRASERRLSLQTRESLAAEAFAYTARYDTAITRWFQEKHEDFPPLMVRAFERQLELPYGENPHQRAAFYTQVGARAHVLSQVAQLGGKELSFNNLLDLDSARQLLVGVRRAGLRDRQAQQPLRRGGRHDHARGLPARLRLRSDLGLRRRDRAEPPRRQGRPRQAIHEQFAEIVLARGFDDEALEIFADKPNMRILDDRERRLDVLYEPAFRQVIGGVLVQDRDSSNEDREEMEVVSERRPTEEEWSELLFAWRVCKHVKSNAIVLAKDGATIGIGAGQMSRVDSVRIAIEKAQGTVRGSVLASDAFFPFPDGPEIALEQGVTAIIQPGGSIRDPLVGRGGRPRRRGDGLHRPPPLPALTPGSSGELIACPPSQSPDPAPRRAIRPRPSRARSATAASWPPARACCIGGTTSVDPSGFVVGATPYEQTRRDLRASSCTSSRASACRPPTSSRPACTSPTSPAPTRSAAPTARSSATSGRWRRWSRSPA